MIKKIIASFRNLFKSSDFEESFIESHFIPSEEVAEKMNIVNSSFFPINNLKFKENYKEYLVVKEDGKTLRRIFLNIFDPSNRELLIFKHYFSRRVKFFSKVPLGFNIVSRDEPWDFKLEISNGEELNVEITSISDNSWNFEMLKNEERIALKSNNEKLPLHELKKLNRIFPDQTVAKLVKHYEKNNYSKKDEVKNPFYEKQISTYGRVEYPIKEISDLLEIAIRKKEEKNHLEKENTVLIIDNRTFTPEIEDFINAFEELGDRFSKSPFKEIWMYTGYYSSLDGNDAEYNLIPLKVTNEQQKIMEKIAKKSQKGKNGTIYT